MIKFNILSVNFDSSDAADNKLVCWACGKNKKYKPKSRHFIKVIKKNTMTKKIHSNIYCKSCFFKLYPYGIRENEK